MRKITFGCANSLDNFIARPDGSVDWLMWSDEVMPIMNEYWAKVDTVLMGRKTYEIALKQSKGKKNPYPNIKSYVFSKTWAAKKEKDVEIVTTDAVEFVKNLKEQDGKEICLMGGGDFAKTLFEAKLIDEIGFNIHPVLLGAGIPLFLDMKEQINLELIENKTLKNGCLVVTYHVR
jgi:dihydrofolate reductase